MDPGTNDLAHVVDGMDGVRFSAQDKRRYVYRFHRLRNLNDHDRHRDMNESKRHVRSDMRGLAT